MGTPPSDYNNTTTGYEIHFYVDGSPAQLLDSNFDTCTIENKLDQHYPIVYLNFHIDNQVFIENNLYPHKSIRMEIKYGDEDNKVFGEPMKVDLTILEMNVDLPQKYRYNISDKWEIIRKHTIMTCVPTRCYEIMQCTVNKMWDTPVTVENAIQQVIDELNFPPYFWDHRKVNKTLLPQLLVPPMSFRDFLLYMDEKYGIYNGKLHFYVHYTGTFHMWELKRHFDDYKTKGGIYNIHKMPSYTKADSEYDVPAKLNRTTPNNYITYNEVETLCMPNDPFTTHGGQQLHIFHPKYDISQLKDWDPIGKAKSDGIHSGKIDLKTNTTLLKKRIRVIDDYICDENNKSSDIQMMANFINPAYKMNYFRFKIIRKVKAQLIMKIGEPVNVKMYAESEKLDKGQSNYDGEYLITESVLNFTRNQGGNVSRDDLFITATITCVRTSQSH